MVPVELEQKEELKWGLRDWGFQVSIFIGEPVVDGGIEKGIDTYVYVAKGAPSMFS